MRNAEIQRLINDLKRLLSDGTLIDLPKHKEYVKLNAKSQSDFFIIDVNRRGNSIKKITLQLRAEKKKELPLLRLDILGPPHPNPEGDFPYAGEIIPCPHLHIAHEDYGDAIAYPLNSETANLYLSEDELQDLIFIFKSFLFRCNIVDIDSYTYSLQSELEIN